MHGGGATVADYQNSKNLPLEYSAKHVALKDASATGVYLKKYTPKGATGKKLNISRFSTDFLNSLNIFFKYLIY